MLLWRQTSDIASQQCISDVRCLARQNKICYFQISWSLYFFFLLLLIVKQKQAEKKLAELSGKRPGRKRKNPVDHVNVSILRVCSPLKKEIWEIRSFHFQIDFQIICWKRFVRTTKIWYFKRENFLWNKNLILSFSQANLLLALLLALLLKRI